MDRSTTRAPEHRATVRVARAATVHVLLRAPAGECREPAPAPAARRTVYGLPVFRQPPNGGHAGDQPQARSAADAYSRHRSALSQTESEPSGVGPRDLSVPAARCPHHSAQSGLEYRYYLHSDAWRISLPGCRHRLVQPFRAQLGTFQYDGNRLLPRGAGRCLPLRSAGYLEQRSGLSVHRRRFSGAAQEARHLDQHGWPRPRARQRFHRTHMAIAEVRTHLSRRLRRWTATVRGAGALLPLLQSPASTPGAGLQDARGFLPAQVNKETPMIVMGALPPNPRDLAQFLTRMDDFAFVVTAVCRTMEKLDRRIGQRRDATRAPIQVRNGWRSHDRLLLTPPPHHLRTVVFLSNQWGPLHTLALTPKK